MRWVGWGKIGGIEKLRSLEIADWWDVNIGIGRHATRALRTAWRLSRRAVNLSCVIGVPWIVNGLVSDSGRILDENIS